MRGLIIVLATVCTSCAFDVPQEQPRVEQTNCVTNDVGVTVARGRVVNTASRATRIRVTVHFLDAEGNILDTNFRTVPDPMDMTPVPAGGSHVFEVPASELALHTRVAECEITARAVR